MAEAEQIGDPRVAAAGEFSVVGVGASAGGLESLERLFSILPANTGMAFVVLQHLSPDFKSLMDELLARRTSMPVRLAENDTLVQPDSVYLLPPMKEMVIRDRRLMLADRDPRHGLAMPIDLFFRSLAHDLGERERRVARGQGSAPRRRCGLLREPGHGRVQRHAAERTGDRRGGSGAGARSDR
jgi:two-component system, chemotaxis family, CheB/CheR fusion protein